MTVRYYSSLPWTFGCSAEPACSFSPPSWASTSFRMLRSTEGYRFLAVATEKKGHPCFCRLVSKGNRVPYAYVCHQQYTHTDNSERLTTRCFHQPTNQPTDRPTDRPTNQPTNQLTKRHLQICCCKIRRPSASRPSLLQRGPAWDATGSDWNQ